ncbi:hypothetical protein SAMN05421720_101582 [Rhodospira trueperi]|uniref:Uncharacterized protein n=1 Tax=Rhodospira trueperi TaxID=69960 RepID=A0A1G6XS78_9PROT|nr:hypothetical protein SAMN05421720_101582 [Rhodospira trueperi]
MERGQPASVPTPDAHPGVRWVPRRPWSGRRGSLAGLLARGLSPDASPSRGSVRLSGLSKPARRSQLRGQPRIWPLMGTPHRVPFCPGRLASGNQRRDQKATLGLGCQGTWSVVRAVQSLQTHPRTATSTQGRGQVHVSLPVSDGMLVQTRSEVELHVSTGMNVSRLTHSFRQIPSWTASSKAETRLLFHLFCRNSCCCSTREGVVARTWNPNGSKWRTVTDGAQAAISRKNDKGTASTCSIECEV